jgi:TolB protein
LVAVACLTQVTGVQAVQNDTILISRTPPYGPGGNDHSLTPSVSADGRFVAFQSNATNFPGGANGWFNIYLRDRVENTLTLVSAPTGEPNAAANDFNSVNGLVSADGRFVAFESASGNLSPDDNDAYWNIYVRDVIQKTTTLISQPTGTSLGTTNNHHSLAPSISADGRYVAFQSKSDNLADDNNDNDQWNVYVRDQVTNTTTLVSKPVGANGTANDGDSEFPWISADGRFVSFDSTSNNMSTEDNNDFRNVFVRDATTDSTILVSRPTTGDPALNDASSSFASISADGRSVAFHSTSNNLSDQDNDALTNVFVRDLDAGTTTLASRPSGQNGFVNGGGSSLATISADGRYVAFQSDANNFSTSDNNNVTNVFLHDVIESTTVLVSAPSGSTSGTTNSNNSTEAAVSGDGRFVAFSSLSHNLSTEDDNSVLNVFLRDVLGPQAPPSFSVNNVSKSEGNTGTKVFTFTVTLDGTAARPVTVDFATKDVTANGTSDYVRTNGTLSFTVGVTSQQVQVSVNGDKKREPRETFKLKIFNPVGAEIEDPFGVGTLKNDDG